METIEIVLALLLLVIIFYFRFGPGKKYLTKDINALETKYQSSESVEIVSGLYDRYYVVNNIDKAQLREAINELTAKFGNHEDEKLHYKIGFTNNCIILKIHDAIDFYIYHNLIAWIKVVDKSVAAVGYSAHKTDPVLDYNFVLDPKEPAGDTVIGRFQNGDHFSLVLPAAFYGRLLKKSKVNYHFDEHKAFADLDFDKATFEKMDFQPLYK
ncbi:MAG: hypothetical protein JJU02_04460 [Cryomorphaceae bacterium]|nr:hypothetical protein [Cryomorphaceae bacterium]